MVLRIFKFIATSSFLTALECTEYVFGLGSAPDPTGGAYSAPPDPVVGLKGKGKGKQERESNRGEEGDGRDRLPPSQIPGSAPVHNGVLQIYALTLTLPTYLIALIVRSQNLRLKNRVYITSVWMAACVDEVSEVVRAPERSTVIGWPTTNLVATFDSVDVKQQFEMKLKRCALAQWFIVYFILFYFI